MSTNELVRVQDFNELNRYMAFFEEGRVALSDPAKARMDCPGPKFLNMLAKVVNLGPKGLLLVLTSKNSKPLAFGCAFEATDFNGDACCYIWATYSNNKCATATRELLDACEQWSRRLGMPVLRMATKRITGAAKGYFTSLGFQQEYLTFVKPV